MPSEVQEKVSALNKLFKRNKLDSAEVERQLVEIITSLYKKEKNVAQIFKRQRLSEDNEKIFEAFWSDIYEPKYLEDKHSTYLDFHRALRFLKHLSLIASTKVEIQKQLQMEVRSVSQHRRAVDRLNEILKYLKREIKLEKPKEPIKKIRHVTYSELQRILARTPDEMMYNFILAAFGSGLRLGEMMALEQEDLKGRTVNVTKQIVAKRTDRKDIADRLKKPKREKTGKVVVISEALEAMRSWAAVENKEAIRETIKKHLKKTSRELWPTNISKHISVHDLRHSHAIHLLSKGASLTMIALNLRNRIEVCQKYYAGFSHTDETTELLKSMV